jgi:hypothetical protein
MLPAMDGHADDVPSCTEHVTELIASLTHQELFRVLYVVTDVLSARGSAGVPRAMTTRVALHSGLLDPDILRSMTITPDEQDLMEVLLRAVA